MNYKYDIKRKYKDNAYKEKCRTENCKFSARVKGLCRGCYMKKYMRKRNENRK